MLGGSLSRVKRWIKRFYYVKIKRDQLKKQLFAWKDDEGDSTLRVDYPLNEESVVVDVGGYLGDFAYSLCELYDPYVYIFEPVQEYCEKIKERFEGNRKVKVLCCGLAAQSGSAVINIDATSSSLYKESSSRSCEEVQLVGFDEFVSDYGLDFIDLMKINIEGAEYSLLEGILKNGEMGNIGFCQIQFHTFVENAYERRSMIREGLKETHALQWDYPFVWESWKKVKS